MEVAEVRVKAGQELNGLGSMLQEIIDTNLKDSKKYKSIERVKGSVVIKESTSAVAVTLHLRQGKLELENDAIAEPTAYMEAGFENLAHISSGQTNPVMAMLSGKLKAKGNPLLLLKIAKILVLK